MINMGRNNLLICFYLLLSHVSFSQLNDQKKFHFPDIKTSVSKTKSGPYFGYQRGKYDVFEIGFEKQWKKKLIKPTTNALHFGINYNYKTNVLGYDLGYWYKKGRLNFTYGVNLCLRTDFTQSKIGFAPVIGYKIWQFHLQTGYHFLTKTNLVIPTNTFFISLRFVLINNQKLELD